MIDYIFYSCVDLLNWIGAQTGLSYNAVNVAIFCLLLPLVLLGGLMYIIYLRACLKVERAKTRLDYMRRHLRNCLLVLASHWLRSSKYRGPEWAGRLDTWSKQLENMLPADELAEAQAYVQELPRAAQPDSFDRLETSYGEEPRTSDYTDRNPDLSGLETLARSLQQKP